jgi:N-acetylated-alpha-linked acidic dipeptidase
MTFSQESSAYGTYHSIYDSFYYHSKLLNPSFEVCKSISSITGLVLLRLANDYILPFKTYEQYELLRRYFDQIYEKEEYKRFYNGLGEGFKMIVDEKLRIMNKTINEFEKTAISIGKEINNIKMNMNHFESKIRVLNDKLMMFERGFTRKEGIKNRSWYKHMVNF